MTRTADEVSTQVAAHLMPTRSFDGASRLVVAYLQRVAPMGLWAVTRIGEGEQLVLAVDSTDYPVGTGDVFPYEPSLCRQMLGGHAPGIAPDVAEVPAYAAAAATTPIPVRAYAGTPIVRPDGELFGSVCGYSPEALPAAFAEHQPLLDLLSSLLSAVLEGDLRATADARELEQARHEADLDPLTGLLNRRGWDRYLEREEQRFRRFGDPACVVVIDLDRLKAVNDTLGHDAGDRYIQSAASALTGTVRDGDVLARLGGDEFGIIAVGATPELATALVGRAEWAMRDAGVAGSFGLAPYSVVSGFPGAWKAADEAMYEQKRRRRSER